MTDLPDCCVHCKREGDWLLPVCPLCSGSGRGPITEELADAVAVDLSAEALCEALREVSEHPRTADVDQLWSVCLLHASECVTCTPGSPCDMAQRLGAAWQTATRAAQAS